MRYIFTVDFENENEWSIGTLPGYESGESADGKELTDALRRVADEIEKWDRESEESFSSPVKYSEHPRRIEINIH